VGSKPKKRKGTSFLWVNSKQCSKRKGKKPLATTLGSNRGGGKFNVPIFLGKMNVFQVFQTCKIVFQGSIDSHICLFQIFK
jgi:hypothetical protein